MYKSIPILNDSHWKKYLQGISTVPTYNGETPYKRIYSNINIVHGITYTLDDFKIKHSGNNNTSGIKIYVFYR